MLARPSPAAGAGFNEVGKRDPQTHGFSHVDLQNTDTMPDVLRRRLIFEGILFVKDV
jgi:hypothetical protein